MPDVPSPDLLELSPFTPLSREEIKGLEKRIERQVKAALDWTATPCGSSESDRLWPDFAKANNELAAGAVAWLPRLLETARRFNALVKENAGLLDQSEENKVLREALESVLGYKALRIRCGYGHALPSEVLNKVKEHEQ